MAVRHKLKIFSWRCMGQWLWYVECQCGWDAPLARIPGRAAPLYGRPSFDVALATGIVHLKEAAHAVAE